MSRGGRIRVRCPAKVNLFLEVISRRPDGYHEIRTVLRTVDLHDTLQAEPAGAGVRLRVEGAALPAGPENLVHRAAAAFFSRFGVGEGAALRLVKRIPVEAGLGGGSSDAAGTLLALRDLFRPRAGRDDLLSIARELGSDVPFFLHALAFEAGETTALARGRGERVEPVPGPRPGYLVLGAPPFGVATAAVYRAVRVSPHPRSEQELLRRLPGADLAALRPWLTNRLEEAALRVEPRLAGVREKLAAPLSPGEALLLSGSGGTFFAAVADRDRARDLAKRWNAEGAVRALVVRHPGGRTLE